MKNLFLSAALLFVSTTIFSQETVVESKTNSDKKIAIGFRYGIGSNTINTNNSGGVSLSSLVTPLNFGFIVEGNMSKSFAIQPEIQFAQKGFSASSMGVTVDAKLNYLGINVLPKIKLGNENVEAFLLAGPSLNANLSAKVYSNGQNADLPDADGIDFGAIFGGGIASKFKSGKVFLDLRYYVGLTDISTETPKVSTDKLNQFGINIGLLFNLK